MNREPTNILIICNYSSIYGGNFIASIKQLCKHLKNAYNIVSNVALPNAAKDRTWANWLASDANLLFFDCNNIKKSLKAINRILNPSIVYTHFCNAKFVFDVKRIFKNARIFSHIHSDFSNARPLSFLQKIKLAMQSRLLNNVVQICVSKDINNIPKTIKRFVIENAICNEREPISDHLVFTKKDLGLSNDDIIIEMFGWSPYTKGVDIAIKAIELMHNNSIFDNVYLLIVCDEQNITRDFIITKFGQIPNFVILVKPRSNVFDFHNLANVFLSSSRSEGFSYTALESLSIGLKCVISDINGTKWTSQFNGVSFFKACDSNDLKNVLEKTLLSNDEIDMKENITLIKEKYSIEKWCEGIGDILLEDYEK